MKIIYRQQHKRSGFISLEVVIAAALVVGVLLGAVLAAGGFLRLGEKQLLAARANFLLIEGMEAARWLRDGAWANVANLNPGEDYFLSFNGSAWATTAVNAFVDERFERRLATTAVYRDGNDDIAPGGVLDPDTRLLTVTVSWRQGAATTTQTLSAYLTNLFDS